MDLKGIMLSEISQRKINTIQCHLHVESKRIKQTRFMETVQTNGCQKGGGKGMGERGSGE